MKRPDSRCACADAAEFGFLPEADGVANQIALQRAVDRGGEIIIVKPGIYELAGTVYVGSDTSLSFAAGTFIKKVAIHGPFSHVLLNKGALTRSWDQRITIDGLHIVCNGVDARTFNDVFGLHGQLAFFYVRDLRITRFRCMDLGKVQYGIHVCTFEDLLIQDVIIHGMKDGVHLGRGQRFTIRDGTFRTFDDAIALNAHDYDVGNPELGWIEHGLIENCHDLDQENTTGFFCRILAGAWCDWYSGMSVQKSDTVVHNHRLYRVRANPDGQFYQSTTPPSHDHGSQVLDGINWVAIQDEVTHTCGVRHVVFRDIWLHKPRTGFSIHFDQDKFSRSYYPGAPVPRQENILIDSCFVLHGATTEFVRIHTPLDSLTICNSRLSCGNIAIGGPRISDRCRLSIALRNCTFTHSGPMPLLEMDPCDRQVRLSISGSTVIHPKFRASVTTVPKQIEVDSDLPGLSNED